MRFNTFSVAIKAAVAAALLSFAAWGGGVFSAADFSPSTLSQQILRDGSEKTAVDLSHDPSRWGQFIKNVGTGKKEWTKLALSLYPFMDSKKQMDLRRTFEDSITVSPEEVVEAVGSSSSELQIVCGPSVYNEYDRAKDSDDNRYDAVAALIAEQQEKSTLDKAVVAELNKCADLLDAASNKLDREFSDRDNH